MHWILRRGSSSDGAGASAPRARPARFRALFVDVADAVLLGLESIEKVDDATGFLCHGASQCLRCAHRIALRLIRERR